MHVAVIGGGIGGLSLALQLERAGIRCRVYEGVADYAPLGVGINLFPHAVRRLHHLGLEDALRPVAVQEQEFAFFTRHGQRVYFEPSGRSAGYDVAHACGTTGRPSREPVRSGRLRAGERVRPWRSPPPRLRTPFATAPTRESAVLHPPGTTDSKWGRGRSA